jgi:hypothetical protein
MALALLAAALVLTGCPNPVDDDPARGGTVSITGTAQVGQTLTAFITALTGQAGTLHYQWKAGDDNVGTDQNTYNPVAGDVGKTITVIVSSSGNSGNGTSAPTTAVAANGMH